MPQQVHLHFDYRAERDWRDIIDSETDRGYVAVRRLGRTPNRGDLAIRQCRDRSAVARAVYVQMLSANPERNHLSFLVEKDRPDACAKADLGPRMDHNKVWSDHRHSAGEPRRVAHDTPGRVASHDANELISAAVFCNKRARRGVFENKIDAGRGGRFSQ